MNDHQLRRLTAVACTAAVIALGVACVLAVVLAQTKGQVQGNTDNATVAKRVATKADAKANTAKTKANKNDRTVKDLGTKIVQQRVLLRETRTVLKQVGILGRTGARGPRGLPGVGLEPTQAALDAAVVRYCAANTCSRPPTAEQVYAAIQACAQAGGCRGPSGQDGKDGKDAPPVTDQQLDASTARYCDAHGGCAGPMGLNGRDGAAGPPGAPAQPFTFSWDDLNGRTHVCTIDPMLGPDVVQPCSS